MKHKQSKYDHQKNVTAINRPQKGSDSFNCRAPYVFSIPRMYDDDYERNDAWYLQLQRIEIKAKELKEEMSSITNRHIYLYNRSKRLVEASLERCNKFIYKNCKEESDSLSLY